MKTTVDITSEQRKTLLSLLRRFIPGVEVWAYGSRVKWTSHPGSDLDLVVFTAPDERHRFSELKDALAESNLPFMVGAHVWAEEPESFQEIIRKDHVVLQEKTEATVPDGWLTLSLSDLGRIVTGKTPLTSVADNFGGDVLFVTPSDMDGRKTIRTTGRYLTEKGSASVKGSRIPAHSVMVSCIGSDIGKAAIAGRECVTNQQINSIIVDERYCSEFIYYDLSTRKAELQHIASGAAQPILNKGHFGELRISLPPLPEQKAIATVLGALDDKIELKRRMNATLEAMARTLFQSWFVDFDPVRAKAEGRPPAGMDESTAALFPAQFQASELGEIPQGWRVGTLGEVAGNQRRSVDANEIDGASAYIGLEHMPRRCIALTDWGSAEGVESHKFEFKSGEVLFGKLRPYFHKVGVAPIDGVCSTDILVITADKPVWFGFVLGHVSSVALVNHTDAMSTGPKMPRATWQDIADFKIALPPQQIASAFTRVIDPLVQRIVANLHQSRTLATLRDTLLPKLLSGSITVAQLLNPEI